MSDFFGNDEDYIKRGDVFSLITFLHDNGKISNQCRTAITERLYNRIPAANVVEVVRGTWIEIRDPYGDLQGWIHECCGHETNAATEYCSTCGAKMTFVEQKRKDVNAHD